MLIDRYLQGFSKKHPKFVRMNYVGFSDKADDNEEGKVGITSPGKGSYKLCIIGQDRIYSHQDALLLQTSLIVEERMVSCITCSVVMSMIYVSYHRSRLGDSLQAVPGSLKFKYCLVFIKEL